MRAGGKAAAIAASVSNEDDVTRLFEEVGRAFGRVDVLVNNAGVYDPKPIEHLSVLEFNRHFDTNVLGLLLVTKASLKLFPATGGSIVNISSVVSSLAPPAAAIYVGTKGAVDSITKSLAKEFAPRKIRVNSVRPGFVITEGTHSRRNGRRGSSRPTPSPILRSDAPVSPRTSPVRLPSWLRTMQAGSRASRCSWLAAPACSSRSPARKGGLLKRSNPGASCPPTPRRRRFGPDPAESVRRPQ